MRYCKRCKGKSPNFSGIIFFCPLPHALGGRHLGPRARVNFFLGFTVFVRVRLGKNKCQRRLEVEEKQQNRMWGSQMRERRWETQHLPFFIVDDMAFR